MLLWFVILFLVISIGIGMTIESLLPQWISYTHPQLAGFLHEHATHLHTGAHLRHHG